MFAVENRPGCCVCSLSSLRSMAAVGSPFLFPRVPDLESGLPEADLAGLWRQHSSSGHHFPPLSASLGRQAELFRCAVCQCRRSTLFPLQGRAERSPCVQVAVLQRAAQSCFFSGLQPAGSCQTWASPQLCEAFRGALPDLHRRSVGLVTVWGLGAKPFCSDAPRQAWS